ncbi:type II secretion system F family protein [Vibrio pectenicida]|uniref:Type II secretion system F family protein n=1 Tax=Vibrio pectenicida TaxID=62763 RepID=A0A427U6Y9_9VIBR|nr:type II secretion system F family protein [Vibrio pectenicida]RSD32436.1 type II secretion system F family protein [Vibrio pectenicida]
MILMIATFLIVIGILSSLLCFHVARQQDVVQRRLSQVSYASLAAHPNKNRWRWKSNPSRCKQLALIGFSHDDAETQFVVVRCVIMLCGSWLWFTSRSLSWSVADVAQCIAISIISGILVDRSLQVWVERIRCQVARVTPDALDLMVVCVASGLTLEKAFRVVGQEMASVSPAFARQWCQTATEMTVLDSPQQALVNLDQRLELSDINNMVVTMSQALKFGTPLSKALSLIAADSRHYQLLELEEWAGKIPAKMSFPLVVLIMLPVVILIVAPVVLSLFETLERL